jgi:hypothetical protein
VPGDWLIRTFDLRSPSATLSSPERRSYGSVVDVAGGSHGELSFHLQLLLRHHPQEDSRRAGRTNAAAVERTSASTIDPEGSLEADSLDMFSLASSPSDALSPPLVTHANPVTAVVPNGVEMLPGCEVILVEPRLRKLSKNQVSVLSYFQSLAPPPPVFGVSVCLLISSFY